MNVERQLDKTRERPHQHLPCEATQENGPLSLPNSTLGSGIARCRYLDPGTSGGTDRPGQLGRDSK
jgi:hypothetical protein